MVGGVRSTFTVRWKAVDQLSVRSLAWIVRVSFPSGRAATVNGSPETEASAEVALCGQRSKRSPTQDSLRSRVGPWSGTIWKALTPRPVSAAETVTWPVSVQAEPGGLTEETFGGLKSWIQ